MRKKSFIPQQCCSCISQNTFSILSKHTVRCVLYCHCKIDSHTASYRLLRTSLSGEDENEECFTMNAEGNYSNWTKWSNIQEVKYTVISKSDGIEYVF